MHKITRYGWLGITLLALGCGGTKELGPASEDQTPKVSQEELKQQMSQGAQQQNTQNIPEQYRGKMRGSTPPTK